MEPVQRISKRPPYYDASSMLLAGRLYREVGSLSSANEDKQRALHKFMNSSLMKSYANKVLAYFGSCAVKRQYSDDDLLSMITIDKLDSFDEMKKLTSVDHLINYLKLSVRWKVIDLSRRKENSTFDPEVDSYSASDRSDLMSWESRLRDAREHKVRLKVLDKVSEAGFQYGGTFVREIVEPSIVWYSNYRVGEKSDQYEVKPLFRKYREKIRTKGGSVANCSRLAIERKCLGEPLSDGRVGLRAVLRKFAE